MSRNVRGVSLDVHLRAVLDGAADGVLVEARDRILYINPSYARMLGYRSVTDLSGATVSDIAHPDELEQLEYYGRCRRLGSPAPLRYVFRARGCKGTVTFDASVSLTRIPGDVLITTIVRDLFDVPHPLEFDVPGLERLSDREREVIRHVLLGLRSKQIAVLLGVSEKTIGTHRSHAFHKLGLRNDLDLFRLAARIGAI